MLCVMNPTTIPMAMTIEPKTPHPDEACFAILLKFLPQRYDKKGTLAKKNAPAGNGGGAKLKLG